MAEDPSAVEAPATHTPAEIRRELARTRQRMTANVDAVEARLKNQASRWVDLPQGGGSGEPDFLNGVIRVLAVIREVAPVRRWVGTPVAIAGLAAGFAIVTLLRNRHR
jgi:hypothetical protein